MPVYAVRFTANAEVTYHVEADGEDVAMEFVPAGGFPDGGLSYDCSLVYSEWQPESGSGAVEEVERPSEMTVHRMDGGS